MASFQQRNWNSASRRYGRAFSLFKGISQLIGPPKHAGVGGPPGVRPPWILAPKLDPLKGGRSSAAAMAAGARTFEEPARSRRLVQRLVRPVFFVCAYQSRTTITASPTSAATRKNFWNSPNV